MELPLQAPHTLQPGGRRVVVGGGHALVFQCRHSYTDRAAHGVYCAPPSWPRPPSRRSIACWLPRRGCLDRASVLSRCPRQNWCIAPARLSRAGLRNFLGEISFIARARRARAGLTVYPPRIQIRDVAASTKYSSAGSSKIEIRTSSRHKANCDLRRDEVRILIFDNPAEL
jgi:hypothetical protein